MNSLIFLQFSCFHEYDIEVVEFMIELHYGNLKKGETSVWASP